MASFIQHLQWVISSESRGGHVNIALKHQEKCKDLCSYSSFLLACLCPVGNHHTVALRVCNRTVCGYQSWQKSGISKPHSKTGVYPTFLQHSHSSPSSVPLPVWLLIFIKIFGVTWLIRSLPCSSLFILALSKHFKFHTTDIKPRAWAKMRRKGS